MQLLSCELLDELLKSVCSLLGILSGNGKHFNRITSVFNL